MFHTFEVSDPRFEFENLRFVTVKSSQLRSRADVCLFIPSQVEANNIPLIILLHGVYGSAWAWALKGGVHKTANRLMTEGGIKPMAIAMPSDGLWGDGSGYLPHSNIDFERWIVSEVPQVAMKTSTLISESSQMFISGLSMGGFGALRLGIKYQPRFKGISVHSSITALDQMALFVEESISNYRQQNILEETVWGIIEQSGYSIPPLRFDCGSEDLLLEPNRKLHQMLNDHGIDHHYQEFPGGHEWTYWEEHIRDSLIFFDALL